MVKPLKSWGNENSCRWCIHKVIRYLDIIRISNFYFKRSFKSERTLDLILCTAILQKFPWICLNIYFHFNSCRRLQSILLYVPCLVLLLAFGDKDELYRFGPTGYGFTWKWRWMPVSETLFQIKKLSRWTVTRTLISFDKVWFERHLKASSDLTMTYKN